MLKKLKNIFIIEGNDEAQSIPTSSTAEKPSNHPPSTESKNTSSSAKKNTKPDGKFVNLLLKAIEENNIEGFDYLEFKQSVQSLIKIESDEGKRFQNAFAIANSLGLTKEKLFSSAKHYANVLNEEEKKFSEAFSAQRQKQVDERTNRRKILANSIKQKEDQIKKLQAEIEKEKKQLGTIESDINKALSKVEATKEGFYSAYNMVLGQIKDDLDKINSYLN